jgi:hypothetical protein
VAERDCSNHPAELSEWIARGGPQSALENVFVLHTAHEVSHAWPLTRQVCFTKESLDTETADGQAYDFGQGWAGLGWLQLTASERRL